MAHDDRTAPPVTEDHAPEVREPAGYRHSDAAIQEQVCGLLAWDGELDASRITVAVKRGEVTLSGSARHAADVQRAEQHACAAEGVKLVRNRLTSERPASVGVAAVSVGTAPKLGKPDYER